MSTSYQRVKSEEPPMMPNAAPAYPRPSTTSPLGRLVAGVALAGAVLTLIIQWDHPTTRSIRSALTGVATAPTHEDLPLLPDRLAVCYSGHVGTLASVYKQNIDDIRAFDPQATLFYYLDLHDDYRNARTGATYSTTHDMHELQPAFDYGSPRVVESYTRADVAAPQIAHCHMRDGETSEHYTHNFMQFYAAAHCFDLVKAAELELGARFGWVLHLQPNMKIALKKPPLDAPPRVHLSGAAMALVPRQMADVFFAAVSVFQGKSCVDVDALGHEPCRNYSYPELSTECMLIKWLKRADIIPSNSVYVNRKVVYPDDGE